MPSFYLCRVRPCRTIFQTTSLVSMCTRAVVRRPNCVRPKLHSALRFLFGIRFQSLNSLAASTLFSPSHPISTRRPPRNEHRQQNTRPKTRFCCKFEAMYTLDHSAYARRAPVTASNGETKKRTRMKTNARAHTDTCPGRTKSR